METIGKKKKLKFDLLKLIELVASIVFIVIVIFLITGFLPFSHPLITSYTQSLIQKSSLDTCAIAKVKLSLWKGVTLYDVYASETTGSGVEYELKLSKIRISCNILSTIFKWHDLEREFQQFRGSFYQIAEKDAYTAIDGLLRFASRSEHIKNVTIDGTYLKIIKKGAPVITANRFSFDITREQEKSQNIELNLDAAEFVYLQNEFTFFRATGLYDNRILDISRCRGRIFNGKVKISTGIDLVNKRMHDFTLNASNLNLEQMVSSGSIQGCVSGKMDLDLEIVSSPLQLDSIRGKGIIHVSGISFEETPVQIALVQLLENPVLNRLSFSKMRADFEILNKDSIRADISGNGEMFDFKSNGMLNLHGWINQQVNAALSEEAIEELPGFVISSLDLNENNRRTVRCRIYGTLNEPKVELDREILKNAIGNVFEQMRENFKDFFRKK